MPTDAGSWTPCFSGEQKPLDTEGKADSRHVVAAELCHQPVVASAAAERFYGTDFAILISKAVWV